MRARGYTLIELMVAMLVSFIAIAAGVTLLIASQHWFQTGSDDRTMQETARTALDELAVNLRQAGYGLEPTFVFDFGVLADTEQDRLPVDGTKPRFGGYNCPGGDCADARDSVTGPDELVFYSRDLQWERDVDAASSKSLTLVAPLSKGGTDLKPGQVLQVMCYGASDKWLWAYATVASVDATKDAAKPVVTLAPATGKSYDFPFQNALLDDGCFSAGAASVRAFKIDRYRYFVAAVGTAGAVQKWETPGTRPYLMLDQGLTQDGNPILRAIAADVEDLQVAYVFPLAENGQLLGADPAAGQVLASTAGDDTGINLNPQPPYSIPYFSAPTTKLDLARIVHHPANIRAVRVAITVRAPRSDLGVADSEVPAALNRPAITGVEAGYRRMVFDSTVYTHNLETTLPVFPQYDPTYTAAVCCKAGTICTGNCGGG
jgi:prepilin-type N-terminal cleavage/methylation domain-containing protein